MLSHAALSNLIQWHLEVLPPRSRMLQFASLSFDASFHEMFATWGCGGTLYVASENLRLDTSGLLQWVADTAIEKVILPVTVLQRWAEDHGTQPALFQHLREIITTGEQLQITPSIADLFQQLEDGSLHNHFGPSEAHVVTAFTFDQPPATWPRQAPIGRPVGNSQIYLLNSRLQPVPIGVPGEVYIGGVQLARNYLHRAELTAEKFIPHPCGEPAARLYKTGDLARYQPDGNLEFLGRNDDQLKIRGFRIEPGEIEATLRQHPSTREAVVLTRQDQHGNLRLVAYLACHADAPPSISELRQFLKQRLPEYMLPAAFVSLEAMPLTANGKIDHRALPIPDESRPELQHAYIAPRSPQEEILVKIWSEVLGIEQVGVHDNFFELGGHSLLATQVVSRVRAAFSIDLPLRSLFESPTVADLAAEIGRTLHGAEGDYVQRLTRVERDGELPLSFAQERLWFLQELQSENPFYNMPGAVRLQGDLDVVALQRTFNEILRRHEALRTTFATREGRPVQRIGELIHVELPLVDLRALPASERQEAARHLFRHEAARPFDLGQGPLLRAMLLRLADQEHELLFTIHHVVSDAWSLSVLIRELVTHYQAHCTDQAVSLPELSIQYADFASWQRQWLRGDELARQLAYWDKQLQELPTLALPTDRRRQELQRFSRRTPIAAVAGRSGRAIGIAQSSRGRNAVHDVAGGIQGAALSLHRARGCGGWFSDRGPQSGRDRRLDRLLRQQPGAAHRLVGRPEFPGTGGTSSGDGTAGLRTPGSAV